MKKIFIAYADSTCAYSLKRIGRQALHIGCFDDVVLYTPDMLPEYIKGSPLMKYERGGGFYAWKPAIIWETLQKNDDGDIVVYVDAGCTMRKSVEWSVYFRLLKKYDTICFQYDDEMPEWKIFGNTSTHIKYWTKKNTLLYFTEYFGNNEFYDFNKILGGCLFVKGRNNAFIKQWLDITLKHPDLIMDPSTEEIKDQYAGFAFHKHDQSIITPLAYYNERVLVLPETSETCGEDVFVFASRIRARNFRAYVVLRIKYRLRRILGNRLFECCKKNVHC